MKNQNVNISTEQEIPASWKLVLKDVRVGNRKISIYHDGNQFRLSDGKVTRVEKTVKFIFDGVEHSLDLVLFSGARRVEIAEGFALASLCKETAKSRKVWNEIQTSLLLTKTASPEMQKANLRGIAGLFEGFAKPDITTEHIARFLAKHINLESAFEDAE